MSYTVLARRYRPQNFADMLGQEHIRTAIQNSFKSGQLGHAYLFYGPRGVGKTSSARLLAKLLNCQNLAADSAEPCNECTSCQEITSGNSMDVLEIDAASNRGIDNIRNLRENVKFMPLSSHYKVYIIDEVHMLTLESFNALLKTLEEPPSHVKFIFATTEYHKIPATILSRCQEFHFGRVTADELSGHVSAILEKESIQFEKEALFWIVQKADGSVRDCLSILDQAIAFAGGSITSESVRKLLGLSADEAQAKLLEGLIHNESAAITNILDEVLLSGSGLKDFLWGFVNFIRSHTLLLAGVSNPHTVGVPGEAFGTYQDRIAKLPRDKWQQVSDALFELYSGLGMLSATTANEEKIFIELGMNKLAAQLSRPSVQTLLQTINNLAGQIPAQAPAHTAVATPPAAPAGHDTAPAEAAPPPPPPVSDAEFKAAATAATATGEAGSNEEIGVQDIKSIFMGTDVTEERDLGLESGES